MRLTKLVSVFLPFFYNLYWILQVISKKKRIKHKQDWAQTSLSQPMNRGKRLPLAN
jgi:hypothetical protein